MNQLQSTETPRVDPASERLCQQPLLLDRSCLVQKIHNLSPLIDKLNWNNRNEQFCAYWNYFASDKKRQLGVRQRIEQNANFVQSLRSKRAASFFKFLTQNKAREINADDLAPEHATNTIFNEFLSCFRGAAGDRRTTVKRRKRDRSNQIYTAWKRKKNDILNALNATRNPYDIEGLRQKWIRLKHLDERRHYILPYPERLYRQKKRYEQVQRVARSAEPPDSKVKKKSQINNVHYNGMESADEIPNRFRYGFKRRKPFTVDEKDVLDHQRRKAEAKAAYIGHVIRESEGSTTDVDSSHRKLVNAKQMKKMQEKLGKLEEKNIQKEEREARKKEPKHHKKMKKRERKLTGEERRRRHLEKRLLNLQKLQGFQKEIKKVKQLMKVNKFNKNSNYDRSSSESQSHYQNYRKSVNQIKMQLQDITKLMKANRKSYRLSKIDDNFDKVRRHLEVLFEYKNFLRGSDKSSINQTDLVEYKKHLKKLSQYTKYFQQFEEGKLRERRQTKYDERQSKMDLRSSSKIEAYNVDYEDIKKPSQYENFRKIKQIDSKLEARRRINQKLGIDPKQSKDSRQRDLYSRQSGTYSRRGSTFSRPNNVESDQKSETSSISEYDLQKKDQKLRRYEITLRKLTQENQKSNQGKTSMQPFGKQLDNQMEHENYLQKLNKLKKKLKEHGIESLKPGARPLKKLIEEHRSSIQSTISKDEMEQYEKDLKKLIEYENLHQATERKRHKKLEKDTPDKKTHFVSQPITQYATDAPSFDPEPKLEKASHRDRKKHDKPTDLVAEPTIEESPEPKEAERKLESLQKKRGKRQRTSSREHNSSSSSDTDFTTAYEKSMQMMKVNESLREIRSFISDRRSSKLRYQLKSSISQYNLLKGYIDTDKESETRSPSVVSSRIAVPGEVLDNTTPYGSFNFMSMRKDIVYRNPYEESKQGTVKIMELGARIEKHAIPIEEKRESTMKLFTHRQKIKHSILAPKILRQKSRTRLERPRLRRQPINPAELEDKPSPLHLIDLIKKSASLKEILRELDLEIYTMEENPEAQAHLTEVKKPKRPKKPKMKPLKLPTPEEPVDQPCPCASCQICAQLKHRSSLPMHPYMQEIARQLKNLELRTYYTQMMLRQCRQKREEEQLLCPVLKVSSEIVQAPKSSLWDSNQFL